MKRATLHFNIDGESVDIEIHDDGKVVVPSKEIRDQLKDEQIALKMGFKEPLDSALFNTFWALKDNPFDVMRHHRVFPKMLQYSHPYLHASTAHITEADDELMRENQNDSGCFSELLGYGLYFMPTECGWIFDLDFDQLPSDLVRESMNRSGVTYPLSSSMLEVLDDAYKEGILHVKFDRDAPEIGSYNVHEW